jgi:hypothetical protein
LNSHFSGIRIVPSFFEGGVFVGFRFRKQIKIAPGVKLNINKDSASVSVGGKGLTHTVSTTGKKTTTVGLPGSGLSYSTTTGVKKEVNPESKPDNQEAQDSVLLSSGLPSGWLYENRNLTEPAKMIYTYLQEKYFEEKNKGVLSKYAALKSFVSYIQDLQESCASKDENFTQWFSVFVCDPDSLNMYTEKLKDMEDNLLELLKKEELIKHLKADLLEIIKAEPGIVQSDLYKRFDEDLKSDISNELYWLSRDGVIEREKSGRSYKLYIK